MNKMDVIQLYKIFVRYGKPARKALELTAKHFYFKVCDKVTEEEFISTVETIIAAEIKQRSKTNEHV